MMQKVDFKTNKNSEICISCHNIDPRNTQIVNASPFYPSLKMDRREDYLVLPDIIVNKKFDTILEKPLRTNCIKPTFTHVLEDVPKRPEYEPLSLLGDMKNYVKVNWDNVFGYDSIKYVIGQALNSTNTKRTHILICGAAGTSKTVFLLTVKDSLEQQSIKCHYLDATTLSSSGVIEYLFTNDIDNSIVEIDELDKLKKEHQAVFLNMLETGTLQETKNKKIRKKLTNSVLCLATGNYIDKILDPLKTRFMTFQIPKYTKEEFFEIGNKLLIKKFSKTPDNAQYIVSQIWDIYTKQNIDPNLRYARQVAELTDNNRKNIDLVLNAINKYSKSVIVK